MELSAVKKSVINVLTLVVAIGVPALAYSANILPENIALIVSTLVGVAGAVLHYLAPNTTTNPAIADTQSVKLVAGRHEVR
jgi:hypothetical protein